MMRKQLERIPRKYREGAVLLLFSVSSKMLLYPKCNPMLWQCQATERNETAVYDFYMHQYYHYSIDITYIWPHTHCDTPPQAIGIVICIPDEEVFIQDY